MTADNQTSLRFSLKESIWFQKGQEVAELISISLDPDIVIQERDYEVVVRGELQLTGEYIAQPDEAAFSLRELSPVRTVDAVYTREDGVNEISHSFPLEISIPRSRMKQVDDLYLTIESFDYEMPENGCLQLIADISIGGLCEPEEAREEAEETEEYYDIPIFLQEEARKEEKETEEIEEYYDVPAFLQKE
ncbi:stage VI sporulation protein D, partial [Ectobacillus panaciterrae]|uniref:stage VI sporulation protein D n=1 Tax=Ectobacillus panaciterrae TaxID=363872 RepID=UPI0009D6CA10